MADEESIFKLFDEGGIKSTEQAIRGVSSAIQDMGTTTVSSQRSAKTAIESTSGSLDDLLNKAREYDKIRGASQPRSVGQPLGQPAPPKSPWTPMGQPVAPAPKKDGGILPAADAAQANSATASVVNAIKGVGDKVTTGFKGLGDWFRGVFGAPGGVPPTGVGPGGVPVSAAGGAAGGGGEGAIVGAAGAAESAGSSSGLGLSLISSLPEAGVAAALFGMGQLANYGQKWSNTGTDWSTAGQAIAPFVQGGGFGQGGMMQTTQAMVNASGGRGQNIAWGGNISALGGAESTLMGIRGSTIGSAGFGQALSQASATGVITGQGIQAGAGSEAWLATNAGRMFLAQMGINTSDPHNQSLAGVAETMAIMINGNGQFPTTDELKAMIGPGQPLFNSLMSLVTAMGMPNPQETVSQLISLLMREAQSTTKYGAPLSIASATSPAQARATLQALGYTKTPQYMYGMANQLGTMAGRRGAVGAAYTGGAAAEAIGRLKEGLSQNSFIGGLEKDLGELSGLFGQFLGPVKIALGAFQLFADATWLRKLLGLGKGTGPIGTAESTAATAEAETGAATTAAADSGAATRGGFRGWTSDLLTGMAAQLGGYELFSHIGTQYSISNSAYAKLTNDAMAQAEKALGLNKGELNKIFSKKDWWKESAQGKALNTFTQYLENQEIVAAGMKQGIPASAMQIMETVNPNGSPITAQEVNKALKSANWSGIKIEKGAVVVHLSTSASPADIGRLARQVGEEILKEVDKKTHERAMVRH